MDGARCGQPMAPRCGVDAMMNPCEATVYKHSLAWMSVLIITLLFFSCGTERRLCLAVMPAGREIACLQALHDTQCPEQETAGASHETQ
jgi:hypothetical protein